MSEFQRIVQTEPFVDDPVRTLPHGKTGARLVRYSNGMRAVVKKARKYLPESHKDTQRGLPAKTQPFREVAFFRLAKLLGWDDLVPETVLTSKAGIIYSVQMYKPSVKIVELDEKLDIRKFPMDSDWSVRLKRVCKHVTADEWRRLVLLDLIADSRDRHINNVGFRSTLTSLDEAGGIKYHLVAFDNACSFGLALEGYRNAFHKILFPIAFDISKYLPILDAIERPMLFSIFTGLLLDIEIEHAFLRIQFLLRYPYKLPYKRLSDGVEDLDSFPSYRAYFFVDAT